MKFESLPNELLLDIFLFLNIFQLLHAFPNLNIRFNQLLFSYYQTYHLNFRFLSKHECTHMCQDYLPMIIDRIISLRLSNDAETPHLTELFFSYNFKLNQFNQLQSLSLCYIDSVDILNQILLQCHDLPNLTHLKIIKYYLTLKEKHLALINNIWNLRKLISCDLCYSNSFPNLPPFGITISTPVSSSIRYLTIKDFENTLEDLSDLSQHTPNIRRLSISIVCKSDNEQLPTMIPSIISLNISFRGSRNSLINLFENMPNLSCLTFDTWPTYLNGHEWEEIIRKYLPKIQRFRLRMYFEFPDNDNRQQQAEELLQTFRTRFWLEEHQWFVQCQWNLSYNQAFLYTLPYVFERFHFYSEYRFISTCPNEKDYWRYNSVCLLEHNHPRNSTNQRLIPQYLWFPNVRHFEIYFPFDENFLSITSSFMHLTSLNITILGDNSIHYQLPLLLNQLPTLYALTINVCSSFLSTLFQINNTSIRRLCFKNFCAEINFFSKKQCNAFVKSSLARQCEILFIGIKKRNDIFDLIKSMSNLRVLIIRCKGDRWWKDTNRSSINDKLVEWLRKYLPSTYSISRDREETSNIRLWINQ